MDSFIISMLHTILDTASWSGIQDLTASMAKYDADAFNVARTINSVAVKPVAASIVAIVLVLELTRIGTRYEGDSKMGTQAVAAVMIKAALLVVAIQNTDLMLDAINEIGDTIISGVVNDVPQSLAGGGFTKDGEQAVRDMGVVDGAGLMVRLLIPWLLSVAASVAVKIIVLIRFSELYVLSAGATLPMAFMGNQETKSITVGYLKRYGSAVLHGVMIVIVVAIYSRFNVATVNMADVHSPDALSEAVGNNFGQMIIAPILFLFLIFGSGKLARALMGEG